LVVGVLGIPGLLPNHRLVALSKDLLIPFLDI
jgi:hypothetical protein